MSTDPRHPAAAARARRAPAGDGLRVIALVGRAGSGKSTVARALAARGAEVVDADRLGHAVTDTDPEVRAALAAEYGAGVYGADGRLDRARVAARVFSDPAARARLNALVHPRIVTRIRAALAALRARGFRGPVLVDGALLLEWGFERECDAVIAVTAPEAAQVARLVAARGWSAAEAQRRLAAQPPAARLTAAADEVLVNDGDERTLAAAAESALARLAARAGA